MKNQISKLSSVFMAAVMFVAFACKKPSASFSADKTTAKVGEPVTFTNASEKGVKVTWDFGDGTQSSSEVGKITHVYTKKGTYNVSLRVANKKGKKPSEAAQQAIIITDAKNPVANFTVKTTTVAVGEIVTFNSTSSDAESLTWDFGDGQPAEVNSPIQTHTYAKNGTYTVALTAASYNPYLSNTKTMVINVTGGNGDNATEALLVGNWNIVSNVLVHKFKGVDATLSCPSVNDVPFNLTFTTTAKIEVKANGVINTYDQEGNMRTTGSYSIKNATTLNSWVQPALFTNGSASSAIPKSGAGHTASSCPLVPQLIGSVANTNPWRIVTLDATTLVIENVGYNSNASYSNSTCTPSNPVPSVGVETATQTVTYKRM